jgi:hypothetical protein
MLDTVADYIEADLTHSIHTSARRSFRGCRRRWNWIFREYWYPITTAKPLEFGVAFHVGMETLYTPEFWNKPRDIVLEMAIQSFRQTCQDQYDKYMATLDGNPHPDVLDDYTERKALGEGMLRYHAEVVMPMHDYNHFTPIKVEIPFEVPIEDPETGAQLWCTCDTCWRRFIAYQNLHWPDLDPSDDWRKDIWTGLPVSYGGRIDALFIDDKGKLWVVDWKSAAQLANEQDRTMFLQLDDQITSYCWALWKLGIDVAGFIYHESKKALQVEPEPLKRRYMGKLYSTGKQNSTTYDLFKGTVSENDVEAYEAGLYDEYLDWLKENSTRFHARYQEHRNLHELHSAAQSIYDEAYEMVDPKLRIYPNAGRFNCQTCAFAQPCIGKNQGEDVEYTLKTMFEKRKYHYWTNTKPSTESKGGE